jgi:hypothetical protein
LGDGTKLGTRVIRDRLKRPQVAIRLSSWFVFSARIAVSLSTVAEELKFRLLKAASPLLVQVFAVTGGHYCSV